VGGDQSEGDDVRRRAAARADYRATRYGSLADRLANLVASAESHVDERPTAQAHAFLADVYHAYANLLFKLPASELEWMAVDRASRAARLTDEPLLVAESQRVLSIAYRRAGRPEYALDICTDAVERLCAAGGPGHEMRAAEILCSGAYCAAKAPDRERALELLGDAGRITQLAQDAGQHWTEFSGPTNVGVYAVSVGTALGDPAVALRAMGTVQLAELTSTERRARFLLDAAAARFVADQPERAAHTLIMAARIAPQAIAARPTAADLANTLRQVRPGLHRTLGAVGL
jgi:hypothetical protein